MKSDKQKERLLEELKKQPIVQLACQRTDISSTTYYRWCMEDKEFKKKAEEALLAGSLFINDLAESQLISAVKDRNLSAITYWLRHHHPKYATKIEVTTKLKREIDELTPEQQAVVNKALELASLKKPSKQVTKN